MLQLKNITKDYVVTNELTVHALKDVSLNFRANEFVSILGPSGCGKTTLLNIVGGLDRYTAGDLVINGKSTKGFHDRDWDAYRNRSIGFVFQSYNLIPHMNVLDNVTLSLSLAGRSKAERIEKAKKALAKVGLADQLRKRPNQLSGGQMQRVAIARAIVNDPDIILADEPTGALDTETGVQVMELLKEIANDRLVIMVTHNQELADQYSTRIVRLLDGELISDTNPYSDEQLARDSQQSQVAQAANVAEKQTTATTEAEKEPLSAELGKNADGNAPTVAQSAKSSGRRGKKWIGMSLFTAFSISAKNLWSKKGRTFLTSFAGSIGIFGITLVLAVSSGMTKYVDSMQEEAIGDSSISINETTMDMDSIRKTMESMNAGEAFPQDTTGITPYVSPMTSLLVKNDLSEAYVDYLKNMDSSLTKAIDFTYSIKMNVLHKKGDSFQKLSSWSSSSSQMVSNNQLVEDNYEVLYKSASSETGFPKNMYEVSIVVDRFNRLQATALENLGFTIVKDGDGKFEEVSYADVVDKEYVVIRNDGWYVKNGSGLYPDLSASNYAKAANGEYALTLKVVSVLRAKGKNATNWLNSGLAYLPELSDYMLNDALSSNVGVAQKESVTKNVRNGNEFKDSANSTVRDQYVSALKAVGAYANPTAINIYPLNLEAKQQINQYLDAWNDDHPDSKIVYLDFAELALSMLSTLIDVITYVLVAFSAVSLIVSTVMISVITYTSVIERIKEIGVLRSIGARKRDISGIFNAETSMIGTFAGAIGVVFAIIVGIIVNVILLKAFEVSNIVQFTPGIILLMMALSIGLTLLAGLIPSRIAANKDPVTCLRTE